MAARDLGIDRLNPRQREAVLHPGGPMLVLAGAGSGKTRVIITRIARLIADGVAAHRILGVTFTNKAAREMRERLRGLVGRAGNAVLLSTFHSLGLHILKKEMQAAGLKKGFCIYDQSDQLSLVRELMRRVRVADRRLDPKRLLQMILDAKKQDLSEIPLRHADDYVIAAAELYPRYRRQMRAFNAVDFDDLLLRAREVLRQPEVRERWGQAFDHVLVDEYQDTSPEQLELLHVLAGARKNVCVVGDDDQSIYAWRGADARNILSFGKQFAGTHEVILDQNYRSTESILEAANAVIAHNEVRKPKKLWSAAGPGEPVQVVRCCDGEDEALFVYENIRSLLDAGLRANDIAVLYRANAQSRAFEEKLSFEGVPFRVVGGQAFLERKEVKDVLAYLALARNPFDEVALRRVINWPARGIGLSSVERLGAWAEQHGKSLWWALGQAEQVPKVSRAALAGCHSLRALLSQHQPALLHARPGQLMPAVRGLIETLSLREEVLKADDATGVAERRIENIDEVLSSVARFERYHSDSSDVLGDFVNAALLTQKSETETQAKDGAVTLMTLHSAKGLEFKAVFLVGVEEDLLPHRRSVEMGGEISEERRLCYVGITRARERLFITHARARLQRGKALPRTPSRFLQELPDTPAIQRRDRDAVVEGDEGDRLAEDFFAKMRAQLGDDQPNA